MNFAFRQALGGLGQLQRKLEGSRRFPGQADYAQAIRPVGGNFKFKDRVVQPQGFGNGLPQNGFFALVLVDQNTVGVRIRQVVEGQAQLRKGAEHTIGFHTPHLSLFDNDAAGQAGPMKAGGDYIANR